MCVERTSSAETNLAFSIVLRKIENTNQFGYYYAADNNPLILNPIVLFDYSDLIFIRSKLSGQELISGLVAHRPDTKWNFYCVTNVIFVLLLKAVHFGCIHQTIPTTLLRNLLVKCIVSDCKMKPYQDKLCMFRALAYKINGSVDLKQNIEIMTQMFFSATRKEACFPGVHEDDIPILEELTEVQFEINAVLAPQSCFKRAQTSSLLRYDIHICRRVGTNKLLEKFRCYIFSHFFDRSNSLLVHLKICSVNTQNKYPSEAYQLSKTVFNHLEDVNIVVPAELRLVSHLIVFNFESKTVTEMTLNNTELTS